MNATCHTPTQVRTPKSTGIDETKAPQIEGRTSDKDGGSVYSLPTYLHLNSLKVEWDVAINIHNWSRYVTVISRDIHMYCGRFVGPSRTVPAKSNKSNTNSKESL